MQVILGGLSHAFGTTRNIQNLSVLLMNTENRPVLFKTYVPLKKRPWYETLKIFA